MSNKLISLWFAREAGDSPRIGMGVKTVRQVAIVLAMMALILVPTSVYSVGFGSIKLNSALNEPLDAEIDLLGATAADIPALSVSMAPKEAFIRAGIDRPAFLSKIKFKVRRRDSGGYYIHLTTRERVREPFINFLLEMDWPNGRMLREYTVLLDPPDLFRRQPTLVQAPETTAPEPVQRIPEPLPEPELAPETRAAPAPLPEPIPREPQPEPLVPPSADLTPEPAPQPLPEPELVPEPGPSGELLGPDVAAAEPEPQPLPEPEMAPEPAAQAAPEPLPEPELVPEPVSEPMPEPLPESGGQTFAEEDGLFPLIPLTPYREPSEADYAEPAIDVARSGEAIEPGAEPGMEPPVTGELDYGITREGDNLWSIAAKLRPDDSVTIYQVMMALYNANPEAFAEGNIHRLKVGHVMRISDPTLLYNMSAAEAAEEYQRQTAAWNEYRESVAAVEAEPQPIIAAEPEPAPADVATAQPEGELVLETPGGEPSATAGTAEEVEAQNTVLITLRDEVEQALNRAKADPNARPEQLANLQTLLDEIDRLQRVVSVESSELAALQAELSRINEAAAAPPEVVEEQPTVVAEADAQAEPQPAPETEAPAADVPGAEAAVEAVEEIAPAGEEVLPATGMEGAPVAEGTPEEMPQEAMIEPGSEGVDAVAGEGPEAAPEAPAGGAEPDMVGAILASITGFFAGLLDSPIMLAAIGAVVIVLLLLVFLLIRRRAGSGDESILMGESAAAPASEGTPSEPASQEESSFLSDFAISGMNAIQAEDSEVDPITEADVFMAYGRYEAAEERLKDAISADPQRKELKLKLIELYYTTKNKPAFENAAEELYAALGGSTDDPAWEKVAGMGGELAPDNPLFSGAGTPPVAADAVATGGEGGDMTESEIMDIGLETGIFDAADLANAGDAPTTQTGGGDEGLDFNLEATAAQPAVGGDDGGLDFSLDATPTDAGIEAPTEAFATGDEAVEFNLDAPGEESSAEIQLDTERESEPSEAFNIGLDLGEPAKSEEFDVDAGKPAMSEEFDLEMNAPAASQEFDMGMAAQSQELDLGELNLDTPAGTSEDSLIDLGMDATDAGEVDLDSAIDEVGTKLDLAKAYIDMGDPEGARSILGEVLAEGDDTQKQEAQQLMQQIV
ncbi:MAG TPA: tetratricopeptide repeat protein [Gammaproteobacteria bacterium]|nr:tetratricopeptide repeat protein [Gammaproteobacteria bacterium]